MIYTSPVIKFNNFIAQSDMILQTLHNPRLDQIICGDINVNHHNDSGRKIQQHALLNSYNLFSTINFCTRCNDDSISVIDNIFTDL